MTQSTSCPFQKRYPGPYAYQPGTDGVDKTFDIFCRTTGERIISSNYWYEEENANIIASVVMLALEFSRRSNFQTPCDRVLQNRLKTFRANYPGPYVLKACSHDEDFAEVGVACCDLDGLIIGFQTKPGELEPVEEIRYIVAALNSLFDARSI